MSKELEVFADLDGRWIGGKSTSLIFGSRPLLLILAAVLNSDVGPTLYRAIFESLALAGGYLRVGPPQLEKFPLPKVVSAVKAGSNQSGDRILNSILELSERTVLLASRKVSTQIEFLSEIEIALGGAGNRARSGIVDGLAGKTRIYEFAGDENRGLPPIGIDELLSLLRRNAARLSVSVDAPVARRKLDKALIRNLKALEPMLRELSGNRRSIERLALQLYGLGEA